MDLSHWIWLGTAAYGVHAFEEFELDWRDWARAVIKLPVEWHDFYVVNFLVIVLGVCAANLADASPAIALAFPGLMLVNAIFFHILPMVKTRGRYSPGVATAVFLMLPIGYFSYRAAVDAGLADTRTIIISLVIAAALMATPIVLLHIKSRAYFQQNRA